MAKYSREWERIEQINIYRLRVPSGWLVRANGGQQFVYVPDEKKDWDFEELKPRHVGGAAD